jgi:hypothetical protein
MTPLQLSFAVTLAGGGTLLMHWYEAFEGQPESTGAVISSTVII